MNNGIHMNGFKGQVEQRLGSQTISSTKYVNDYTTNKMIKGRKGQKQNKNDDENGNIITRENLQRESFEGVFQEKTERPPVQPRNQMQNCQ